MNMADVRQPGEPTGRSVSPRMIIIGVLAVLALVFIFQNTDSRQVNVLFWDVTMPTWLWTLILLIVGVIIGSLFPWFRRKRRE